MGAGHDDLRRVDQLLPSSGLYERLNSHIYNVGLCRLVDTTSIWSLTDGLVIPATNAYFPYGRNKVFLAKGHIQLVISPAVFRYIKTRLLAPAIPPAWTGFDGDEKASVAAEAATTPD